MKEKTPNGTLYERVLKKNKKREENVVLYFHGGAFVSGMLSLYRKFAPDFFEAACGAELIFPDYDLAPESLYPTQLEQTVDLWKDLVDRQGYLPENIIFVGDSAGANLALATMLKLRDEGRKLPLACA